MVRVDARNRTLDEFFGATDNDQSTNNVTIVPNVKDSSVVTEEDIVCCFTVIYIFFRKNRPKMMKLESDFRRLSKRESNKRRMLHFRIPSSL